MLFEQITSNLAGKILATTTVGDGISGAVTGIWEQVYAVIKEIGGTLAIATFVCSAFYFFIIGKDKGSLEKAKSLMLGSAVGVLIIYLAPMIVKAVIAIAQGLAK